MARKKKEPTPPKVLTREERVEKALRTFKMFDSCPIEVCPAPTRTFEVGEHVLMGNRDGCVIEEVLFDGKAYLFETDVTKTRDKPNPDPSREFMVRWWYEIDKAGSRSTKPERHFSEYIRADESKSTLDSVFFSMSHNGIVCDPRYQRGYVWTDYDKNQLLESVFDRVGIGKFLFSRHSGYLHENADENAGKTFITLDGEEVFIKDRENYTQAIIDGQQRLTTLFAFWLDKYKFCGKYFSEFNQYDKNEFENTSVVFRTYDEEQLSYKDVLKLFIQSNRGVPQSPEHMEKVVKQYEELS